VFRDLVFAEILVFVAILAAAFAYAWRKGVFEWR
jgi:NADH-quinone oxidoreductase subunit A